MILTNFSKIDDHEYNNINETTDYAGTSQLNFFGVYCKRYFGDLDF